MLSDKLMYYASCPVVLSYAGTMLKTDVCKHAQFPGGAKIFAANHPTTTDPFFVAAMVREQSFILINDLLFQVPILGEYLRRSRHIPVKVGSGPAASIASAPGASPMLRRSPKRLSPTWKYDCNPPRRTGSTCP